jgi:hypothetical protein
VHLLFFFLLSLVQYRTLTFFCALQRAIEVFNITEPKIPQRPPVKQDQKGGWYG